MACFREMSHKRQQREFPPPKSVVCAFFDVCMFLNTGYEVFAFGEQLNCCVLDSTTEHERCEEKGVKGVCTLRESARHACAYVHNGKTRRFSKHDRTHDAGTDKHNLSSLYLSSPFPYSLSHPKPSSIRTDTISPFSPIFISPLLSSPPSLYTLSHLHTCSPSSSS